MTFSNVVKYYFCAMAKIFTTEITSEKISSDNPIHQRLFKAYVAARPYVNGDVLEVGCGEGRGIPLLMEKARSFTAVDKIVPVIEALRKRFPSGRFESMNIPPLNGITDNSYDLVVSFQVIEHIQNDALFLREIFRVLRPGGTAILTTPNKKMSLTRNPWHIREYTPAELKALASDIFTSVGLKGITGKEKVMAYYHQNKKSVEKFTRWDIFKLQYRLPASVLRIPYEILNRWNRNKLQRSDNDLVANITHEDYLVVDNPADALDLLLIVKK
jgi:2-polyprenyl-3-methyl-5-hydroxy-6-metoxy-1,4-benzoquinol methylase